MSTKPTTKTRTRKPPAKALQKPGSPGASGRLTRQETTNLVLQAQEAYNYQAALGRIEAGTDFNTWRRDQVLDSVGKAGISKINRADWRTVKAHFLTLSGRDAEALALLLKTGSKTDRPAEASDTWEASETYAAHIRAALDAHAAVPAAQLAAGKSHLGPGWFLTAARQRTAKPTLTLDTLAERLTPKTLHGLLAHLVSHIALREGRADPGRRQPRIYPPAADPGEIDSPF